MHLGAVRFYNGVRGFGFIQPVDGAEIFVHASALARGGMIGLVEGQQVECDLERDQKGRNAAANLRAI